MTISLRFALLIFSLILSNLSLGASSKALKHTIPADQRIKTMLVLDADSNKILEQKNAHVSIYPASLTKLMTLYIAFQDLTRGKILIGQKIKISKKAETIEPSKLGLISGNTIEVKDAVLGLIVKSANDASIALAEHIGGSEDRFVSRMNKTAALLGMNSTHFTNPHGLHHPNQKTTAHDLSKLTVALKRDFPQYYPWFRKDHFYFGGKLISGHNKVTKNYDGAEGMKTGYTFKAGFNLITAVKRNSKSLIGVLTGYPSAQSRDKAMVELLDKKFEQNGIFLANTERHRQKPASKISSDDLKHQLGKEPSAFASITSNPSNAFDNKVDDDVFSLQNNTQNTSAPALTSKNQKSKSSSKSKAKSKQNKYVLASSSQHSQKNKLVNKKSSVKTIKTPVKSKRLKKKTPVKSPKTLVV